MANGLASELNKRVDPFDVVSQLSTGDTASRGEMARKIKPEFFRAEQQAEEDFAIAKQEGGLAQKQAETRAAEDFATQKRSSVEEYQRGLPARPEFNPTEYDATSAFKTAMLTAVVGAITGSPSARGALKAMQGVSQGAREGREDLYNKEAKRFEQELAAWQDNIKLAKQKLDQTIDLLATDKTAALAKAGELNPLLQRGTVLADVRRQAFVKARKDLEKAEQAADKLEVEFLKSTKKTGLKPSAAERDKYSMQYELLSLGSQIQQKLKDPKLKALVDQPKIRAGLFLQEENKLLDQLLQPRIPQEVRQLAILIKKYRNSVYRAESGLAVTAYEAMRQYGANPQPGSTSQTLLDQIQVLNDVAKRSTRKLETIYPELQEVGLALREYEGMEREGRDTANRQPQVASKADVDATAAANNISVEEAKAKLKERGFKIEGEE